MIRHLLPYMTLFAVLAPTVVSATTIVVLRTDKEVVIAADTLQVDGRDRGRMHGHKILRVGGYYFALAGLASSGGEFDAYKIFAGVAAGGGGVSAVANETAQRISVAYAKFVEGMKRTASAQLTTYGDRMLPTFTVVGWEKGRPVCAMRRARLRDPSDQAAIDFDMTDATEGTACFIVGERSAVEAYANAHVSKLFVRSLPTTARNLVKVQIRATPEWVGGPVDVLGIRDGEHRVVTQHDLGKAR